MDTLKITYYIDMETDQVKPFVHEKTSLKQEYFYLKDLISKVDNSNFSENDKKEAKFMIDASYYVTLLQNGHTYEEILTLLREDLDLKLKTSRKNVITGLSEEITSLEFAHQEKETVLDYMANLTGTTMIFLPKKDPRYLVNKLSRNV